jgi:hypothetical protein
MVPSLLPIAWNAGYCVFINTKQIEILVSLADGLSGLSLVEACGAQCITTNLTLSPVRPTTGKPLNLCCIVVRTPPQRRWSWKAYTRRRVGIVSGKMANGCILNYVVGILYPRSAEITDGLGNPLSGCV